MCGIAGFIGNVIGHKETVLTAMTQSIVHRGPDGFGHWHNASENVFLGHRRLAVIDLTEEGAQPMHYLNRYTLVYNGEIYNYIELRNELAKRGVCFHTASDTEVLLALYHEQKEECLKRLDGMFAFAIYDKEEDTLFCARDRFGEKPFFYHYEEGKAFFFASEMKALWAAGVPRDINHRLLYQYMQFGYVQNPNDASETFFTNIVRLKAAHYLKIAVSECVITHQKQYWSLGEVRTRKISEEQATEGFRHLLRQSVERRLRSDVPVGSSLSGGLDSSLIVMLIDAIKGKNQVQKTFSARFPGYNRDEGCYMQKVIDRCHVDAFFTFPNENKIVEDIEKLFHHQEEPFGSASIYAQYEVMKLARENGVTVLLDGQGADEILAGYHAYFNTFFKEVKSTNPELHRHERNGYLELHKTNAVNGIAEAGLKSSFMKSRMYSQLKTAYQSVNQQLSPFWHKDFLQSGATGNLLVNADFNSLNQHLEWNTTSYGLEQLLRYADRNSMAHSLEVRLPYLSHELVEFVFSLDASFKIKQGWTKWLMRKAYDGFLPPEICWRKDKIGYEPPHQKWLSQPNVKERIQESKKHLVEERVLHPNVLKSRHTQAENANESWTYWMAGMLLHANK